MTLIGITIVPVRSHMKGAYLEFSKRMAEAYSEYGTRRVADCWHDEAAGDDEAFHASEAIHNYRSGGLLSLRRLAGASIGKTVVVSFIEWPDRHTRDQGVKAVKVDLRVQATVHEERVLTASG